MYEWIIGEKYTDIRNTSICVREKPAVQAGAYRAQPATP
jgi:hypothetical protein